MVGRYGVEAQMLVDCDRNKAVAIANAHYKREKSSVR